jgi:hypothetical protein
MAMNWKSYLEQFKEAYKNADVSDTFDELPDGEYVVKVERVELKESNSGRPMLEWEFVVQEGEFAGRHEWKYNLLDNVDRIQWLKKDLFRAGLDLEDITQLEESLPQLLDRKLKITIKTKRVNNGNQYRNVYINKQIETASESNAAYKNSQLSVTVADDDIPF